LFIQPSKEYIRNITSNQALHPFVDPERQLAFQKNSLICQKRAEKASPIFSSIMIRKLKNWIIDLKGKGIKINGNEFPADSSWSGDEIGCSDMAKFKRTFTLGRKSRRAYQVVTNEKGSFWTTILYFTRADGNVTIPPYIVIIYYEWYVYRRVS
jgi:hypothetical protein